MSWELIVYFSMKIKNSDHRAGPFVYISDFFDGVKVKFFRFISKQIQPIFDNLNLKGPEKNFKLPRVQNNRSLNNQEGGRKKSNKQEFDRNS